MRNTSNARVAASRIVRRAWNLPPGMEPGDESSPEPDWQNASAMEVYESADAEELDMAMREAILEDVELSDDQVEELVSHGHYSPVSVELDLDSARLGFQFRLLPPLWGAPERFSVTVRNPFAD